MTVRGLPPTLPLSVWTRVLEPFTSTIDWSSFVPGESAISYAGLKSSVGSPSLAHLHFTSRGAAEDFTNALNGHVFRDASRAFLIV